MGSLRLCAQAHGEALQWVGAWVGLAFELRKCRLETWVKVSVSLGEREGGAARVAEGEQEKREAFVHACFSLDHIAGPHFAGPPFFFSRIPSMP